MKRLFLLPPVLAIFLSLTPALSLCEDIEVYDPLEPLNRGIFWFNDTFDLYLLEPVARGYDYVVPDAVQDGVSNFFGNLKYPQYLLSDLVQLDIGEAGVHTARFLINSTLGVAGIFDVASSFGIEASELDFGLALASQGVPSGPYLVLPFLGPSNLRDGFGRAVDSFIHPFAMLEYSDVKAGVTDKIVYSGIALNAIQSRVDMFEAVEAARDSSLDYYLFVQSAYYQYRQGLLKGEDVEYLSEKDELSWD